MMTRLVGEVITAGLGTVAFALLFHVHRTYFLTCGVIGGCGWIIYRLAESVCSEPFAVFWGVILVVFLARIAAARQRCPVTVFLIAGIFPLVPGAGIYWTAYYTVMNEMELAAQKGSLTLKTAIAIGFGILAVFEIPQKWIGILAGRR